MTDKRCYLNYSGKGSMNEFVEVEQGKDTYVFGIQKNVEVPGVKDLGFYKGLKKSKGIQTDGGSKFILVDDTKIPPQEVVDMAIKRGVPGKIIFPYEK